MGNKPRPTPPVITGWDSPNYTGIPNELLDKHLTRLTHSELLVLLYLFRRTAGFGKQADKVSLGQLANGIVKRDGTRLDYGTGLSRAAVKRAIKSLIEVGAINAIQNRSESGGTEANTYTVRWQANEDVPDRGDAGARGEGQS